MTNFPCDEDDKLIVLGNRLEGAAPIGADFQHSLVFSRATVGLHPDYISGLGRCQGAGLREVLDLYFQLGVAVLVLADMNDSGRGGDGLRVRQSNLSRAAAEGPNQG